MRFWLFTLLILGSLYSSSQNTFRAIIQSKSTNDVLKGATVKINQSISFSNDSGYVQILNLPAGEITVEVSYTGFESQALKFTLPDTIVHQILLANEHNELANVTVVASTRTNQRIENAPMKVEVLGQEEMNEENTIKPGNIASILGDVSGIQIQQSSAVSGNANVRIQGLDGRYTQILRDGMPLFEGFSGGFGILQIPPLDLKQIELIKGSASTLFGGGAIGGLVNLISKKPSFNQEGELTINQTTLKESNLNTYIARRNKNVGYTFFGGLTHQDATDVNKDGFSDVPKLNAYIIHPRFFVYPAQNVTIAIGYSGTFETRNGGDIQVLKGQKDAIHQFFEEDASQRHTGDVQVQYVIDHQNTVEFKASSSAFTNAITTDIHYFKGRQLNYFSELAYTLNKQKVSWVSGINLLGDAFTIKPSDPVLLENFNNNTIGAFTQLTVRLPHQTTLETGLRGDHHDQYGNFFLPRIALFHRFSEQWATRLGAGAGYKTPNPLSPQTTDYAIETIAPLPSSTVAEKSLGYNAEVNFKQRFSEEASLFINHAFFLTRLNNPIVANEQTNGSILFENAGSNITSKGFDTYVQANLHDWELYAGYTFTMVNRNYLDDNKFMPLTPKNRWAFVMVYEIEDKWRFGLEGSYTGSQFRDNDTKTPAYLFMAGVVSKHLGDHFTLVLNCENLLDYRQSLHEALYTGTITSPVFKPLWAPIDGRAVNLSIRWNWAKKA